MIVCNKINEQTVGKTKLAEIGTNRNSRLIDEPARQVSLDLVLASARGVGLPLVAMRTSQTRITPSEDADATKYGSSSEASLFLLKATTPLTRVE